MDELGGSALRLLHQLAMSPAAAEALCRSSPSASIPLMTALVRWGLAGSVLSLETIKRALGLNISSRDLLIAGLLSGGLLPLLLKKLDWQQKEGNSNDEEVRTCVSLYMEFQNSFIVFETKVALCSLMWIGQSAHCGIMRECDRCQLPDADLW